MFGVWSRSRSITDTLAWVALLKEAFLHVVHYFVLASLVYLYLVVLRNM